MSIAKSKVVSQEETGEPAPMDVVVQRVGSEMKQMEGAARKGVAEVLHNKELAREGERLKNEGTRELKEAAEEG
jgi:uncharacterized protein YjbJ (UPF0337 family)